MGREIIEIPFDTYQSWMFGESQNSFPRFWVNIWAIDLLYVYMIYFQAPTKSADNFSKEIEYNNYFVVSACFKHFSISSPNMGEMIQFDHSFPTA